MTDRSEPGFTSGGLDGEPLPPLVPLNRIAYDLTELATDIAATDLPLHVRDELGGRAFRLGMELARHIGEGGSMAPPRDP